VRQAAPEDGSSSAPAAVDPETDAYTRVLFMRLFDGEVARSLYRGYECSLLMVTVDAPADCTPASRAASVESVGFLAEAVREDRRPGDVVGRMGATELAVLLPETGPEEAVHLACQLAGRVQGRFAVEIGASSLSDWVRDAEGFVGAARDSRRGGAYPSARS
jgi:GGDEF domain-containing protein